MSDPRRHGNQWGASEEEALLRRYHSGKSISELAEIHERLPVSIEIRLEKLGVSEFKGTLEKFQRGEIMKPTPYTTVFGFNVYLNGTTHATAVSWNEYAKDLYDDAGEIRAGRMPSKRNNWMDVSIEVSGKRFEGLWMTYEDFKRFRAQTNTELDNLVAKRRTNNEEYQTSAKLSELIEKPKRALPSAAKRRLLLT